MTKTNIKSNRYLYVLLSAGALVVAIYIIFGFVYTDERVACTQEAKLCTDGTSVGRSGPNCEFALCPDEGATVTKYITLEDWPPTIELTDEKFFCTEGISEQTSGRTMKRIISGNEFCVSSSTEGAAGNIYAYYIYRTEKNNKLITLNFTVHSVQCANYDDPNKTACEREVAAFNPDNIVLGIINNLEVN